MPLLMFTRFFAMLMPAGAFYADSATAAAITIYMQLAAMLTLLLFDDKIRYAWSSYCLMSRY